MSRKEKEKEGESEVESMLRYLFTSDVSDFKSEPSCREKALEKAQAVEALRSLLLAPL